jgi:hypothetical protein
MIFNFVNQRKHLTGANEQILGFQPTKDGVAEK